MSEKTVFEHTDDVTGDTYIDVWTNGMGDLHVLIGNGTVSQFVYIRNGEALGKAILKEMWS